MLTSKQSSASWCVQLDLSSHMDPVHRWSHLGMEKETECRMTHVQLAV